MQISRRLLLLFLLLLLLVGCMFLLLDEAKQKLFSACLPNNMPTGTHSLSFKRTQTMTTDKLNSPRVSSGDAPPPPAGKEEKRKRNIFSIRLPLYRVFSFLFQRIEKPLRLISVMEGRSFQKRRQRHHSDPTTKPRRCRRRPCTAPPVPSACV